MVDSEAVRCGCGGYLEVAVVSDCACVVLDQRTTFGFLVCAVLGASVAYSIAVRDRTRRLAVSCKAWHKVVSDRRHRQSIEHTTVVQRHWAHYGGGVQSLARTNTAYPVAPFCLALW